MKYLDNFLNKLDNSIIILKNEKIVNINIFIKSLIIIISFIINVLKWWPWIDQAIVDSISNDIFNINNLSKLYHEDDSRNHHIKSMIKNNLISFNKNKQSKIIINKIKIYKIFKESNIFFVIWEVYILIHIIYTSKRTPDLILFNERIYYILLLNYSWNSILNYIIVFFRKYQDFIELSI